VSVRCELETVCLPFTYLRVAEDACKAKAFKLRDEKHPKYDGKTRTMQRAATGA